jgi:hypothetical protein
MPQYFKAMATVGMWGLYIGAWLMAALTFIFGGLVAGYAYSTDPVPMSYYVAYAVSIGFAFAGGFMMLVRRKIE